MANTIRIRRRPLGGAPGAPASLRHAELAFNEQDKTLYYGDGDGGPGGTASQVVPVAGAGAFATLGTAQTFTAVKTFDQSPLLPSPAANDDSAKAAPTSWVRARLAEVAVSDGDKGDITVTSGVWSIDNNVVTNAKLASVPAATLKGNSTGSAGQATDLTVGAVKTMLAINNVDNTSDANKPISSATQTALDAKVSTSQLGVALGVATLNADGKLNANQVNSLAINSIRSFSSQAAMLAWAEAEEGDTAVRTDLNKTFILSQTPASTLANWIELLTPTAAVSSVFGRVGAIVATAGDYTVAQITGAAPIASPTFTGTPSGPTAAAGTNTTQLATTAFVTAGLGLKANLASPAFTGTPTTPTAAAGTNTTQIASTAFVAAAAGLRLLASSNLSDVPNKATARSNLGLGSMATQNSDAVAITGGTIDNIDLDGGTF